MQSLSGVALMLDAATDLLGRGELEQAKGILERALGRTRATVGELRDLSFNLEPVVLRAHGFRMAVQALAETRGLEHGIQVEMIRLDGSIELAPLVGLAERIVDLVQSGETLRANGLVEVAEIMTSTARLIVNRASLKTAHARVNALIAAMRQEATR